MCRNGHGRVGRERRGEMAFDARTGDSSSEGECVCSITPVSHTAASLL
jgi:hypothetical protein